LVDALIIVNKINDERGELLLRGLLHGVDAEEEGRDFDEGRLGFVASLHHEVEKLLLFLGLKDGVDVGAQDEVGSLLVADELSDQLEIGAALLLNPGFQFLH
jgi:hypothetical protein